MPSLDVVIIEPRNKIVRSLTLSPLVLYYPRQMWLNESAVRGKRQETAQILPYAQSCRRCNAKSTYSAAPVSK